MLLKPFLQHWLNKFFVIYAMFKYIPCTAASKMIVYSHRMLNSPLAGEHTVSRSSVGFVCYEKSCRLVCPHCNPDSRLCAHGLICSCANYQVPIQVFYQSDNWVLVDNDVPKMIPFSKFSVYFRLFGHLFMAFTPKIYLIDLLIWPKLSFAKVELSYFEFVQKEPIPQAYFFALFN